MVTCAQAEVAHPMILSSPYFPVSVTNLALSESGTLSHPSPGTVLKTYIYRHHPDPYRQTDVPQNSFRPPQEVFDSGLTF